MPVAQPEQRDHREMRSGRLAADGKARGSIQELRAMLEQMEDRILAVIRCGGVRVLRREPVVDARST